MRRQFIAGGPDAWARARTFLRHWVLQSHERKTKEKKAWIKRFEFMCLITRQVFWMSGALSQDWCCRAFRRSLEVPSRQRHQKKVWISGQEVGGSCSNPPPCQSMAAAIIDTQQKLDASCHCRFRLASANDASNNNNNNNGGVHLAFPTCY